MTSPLETVRSGYGPAQADCKGCELKSVCLKQRYVEGERPRDWEPGGLMLIGEGPGQLEHVQGRPFVGASGKLLTALLQSAGIEREKVWITNATLGLPPPSKDGALHDRFPQAIYSCLPRLEAEIAEARPRVIVTLGQSAFIAVSGYEVARRRQVRVSCDNADCDPATRKLRTKCIVCAAPDCDWFAPVRGLPPLAAAMPNEDELTDTWVEEIRKAHGGKCPKCKASITRLRPRAMKCPTCGGRKTKIEDYVSFEWDYNLIGREGAAGAVFPTRELTSRLDQFGVEYVVPTYHPAFCLYPMKKQQSAADEKKVIGGQFAARVAVEHFEKARRLLRSHPTFEAVPFTPTTVAEFEAFVREPGTYAVDLEWNADGGPWAPTKITLFGVATAENPVGITVDTRTFPCNDSRPHAWLDAIYRFLLDPTKKKVFHNGASDRVVLARLWGMEVVAVESDTLISHHNLYPDEEQGLGFCAHELLDAPHWKAKRRKLKTGEYDDLSGYPSWEDYALYNARDTRATALIDRVIRGPAGGRGRLDVEGVRAAHDIDMKMQEVAIRMELDGLPVDKERLAETSARAQEIYSAELKTMREIVGRPDWEPTGKDLLWAMFDINGPLRLTPFAYSAETGAPSTAKDALGRMVDQHPFVRHLLTFRKYDYVLKNFIHGEALRMGPDGRLHPQWKVYGTTTGRWTSNPNFQNWSKGDASIKDEALNLRALIAAPPGRRIVGADYAALELRVMADLSADRGLITRLVNSDENDKLNPDRDLHAYIAAKTFGTAYLNGAEKSKKQLRDTEKRIIYGANYGAGAQTILESIYNAGYAGPPITLQVINAVLATIRKEFPGINVWRDKQVKLAETTRKLVSALTKRHRIFPLGEIDSTICYNFGIQAGAADVMNTRLAVLALRLHDVDPTAFFIAQVHDAIYIECAEDKADAVAALVTETMTVELSLGGGAPMLYLASAHHAQTWDQAA